MIADTDTLSLAPGVSVRRGHVADAVRGSAWPLNPSGELVLAHAGLPVAQIVRVLAEAFSLPTEAARRDVLRFVWHVNALALVNVERSGSRLRQLIDWFVLAARLAPAGAVPGAVSRRRGLDTRTMTRGAVSGFRGDRLPRRVRGGRRHGSGRPTLGRRRTSGICRPDRARARHRCRPGPSRGGACRLLARGAERSCPAGPPYLCPARPGRCDTEVGRRRGRPTDGRRGGTRVDSGRGGGGRAGAHDSRLAAGRSRTLALGCGRRRQDRMRALKAFLLGAFAVGVVAYALAAALAVTAQAGGRTLDVSLGPLVLVVVGPARPGNGHDLRGWSSRPGCRGRPRQRRGCRAVVETRRRPG